MAKAVKLADIAGIVGVSTVTVSKALSDQKGVSEELRTRIKQLAEEMGYQQPSAASKTKVNRSYNIGVLIADMFLDKYDSFYWQMYQSVTTRAVAKSCFTMLEVISEEMEKEGSLPLLVKENKVDGVIVIGSMSEKFLKTLEEKGNVPIIYLDYYNEELACDAVISNSYYGTYALTNYLIQMGHKSIAYVGTLLATESITDRYFGYMKSLLEHHLDGKKEWILDDRDIGSGYLDPVNKFQLPENMPTAFVCNCDLTASHLIKKLNENGYRVPEDISVVGFDNFLYPGLCETGITTYEVDIKEMARRAVHNLIKKMEDVNYKPGVFIVEGHLVYKESVKKIK